MTKDQRPHKLEASLINQVDEVIYFWFLMYLSDFWKMTANGEQALGKVDYKENRCHKGNLVNRIKGGANG